MHNSSLLSLVKCLNFISKSYFNASLLMLLLLLPLALHAETLSTEFAHEITGNYELNCEFEGDMGRNNVAKVFFSSNKDLTSGIILELSGEGCKVLRLQESGVADTLLNKAGRISLPWKFKLLKQGSYYRFSVNDYSDWIQGPMGQTENIYEPWTSHIGVKVKDGLSLEKALVTELPMLSQLDDIKVISHDDKGTSWKDSQVLPGTILKWTDGNYYMYFIGATYGAKESGAAHRSIGLAVSSDLKNWDVKDEKVITSFDNHKEFYPGGAVITPEGKVALMFTTQDETTKWRGFFLATADSPDGKFTIENNEQPVYQFKNPAHEFDLVKLENHEFKYLMFFSGFHKGSGDRGFMAFSNDLMTWTEDSSAPNFKPESQDGWDAVHIRPRSLTKVGDMWYLWYEGVNRRDNYYSDVVGLARSKNLNRWEYHPRNPLISGMGVSANQTDNTWTGWPRMEVKDSIGYVFYAGSNPQRNPVDICMKTLSLDELTNWNKTGKTTALVTKAAGNDEDPNAHMTKYAPHRKEFIAMKERMNKGWNTWNTYSLLSHALLPEGLAINLELKDMTTNKVLQEALIGRKNDDCEEITPLAHSYDGAYTDLLIKWHGISARIQSATIGADNVLMITPYESKNSNGNLVVNPQMLWERAGEITLKDKSFKAILPQHELPIYVQSKNVEGIFELSSTLEVMMNDTIIISTGKDRSVAAVAAIVSKASATLAQQKTKYSEVADLYEPMQNVLAWDVIYEPSLDQIIAPVSRVWNVTGFHGWVLFDWDTYFAAYMLALDNKELAYSNALAITNAITKEGFIPNFTSGLGRSDDRSQPPIGSMIIKEIYRKHQEKWFLEEAFEKLLDWNRWWDDARSYDDYLCWGSDPYVFPSRFPSWLRPHVNKIQGSKWESGLDNSPMYDGMRHDSTTHLMRLADVGLMSFYVQDCKALIDIAEILDKPEYIKEIKKRQKRYTKSLQSLWDEKAGIFLNKDFDKNELSQTLSPTLFYPMLAGVASQKQAERLMQEHFYNPQEFWGNYIIPTIARNDDAYGDQDYWRGRIWAPINFLVYLGLRQYDVPSAQEDIVDKSKELILKSWKEQRAVYENYNGTTGCGDDVFNSDKFYHWGALLSFITFIEEGYMEGPEQPIERQ